MLDKVMLFSIYFFHLEGGWIIGGGKW